MRHHKERELFFLHRSGAAIAGTERSAGFVQMLALGGVAILAALVTVALSQSYRTSESLGLLDRQVLGDVAAGSAIRLIAAAIADADDALEQRIGIGLPPLPLILFGHDLSLAIEGEAGKIDVIAGDIALLSRYISQSGLPQEQQVKLLEALAQARRGTDAPAAMEALQIAFAPSGQGARVEEDFTTRSGLAGIDPAVANERVLRSVPDLAPAAVASILSARSSGAHEIPASRYFATGRRSLFTLVATVHWSGTERLTKRVPIEITTGGRPLVLSGFN